jgi:hypothetical protein
MNLRKTAAVLVVLAGLPLAAAFGAGGVSWGEQYLLPEYPELSNYCTAAQFTSVYGYATTGFGMRNGVFVLGVRAPGDEVSWEGGFIGGISGQELRVGPFMLAVNLWTGLGGIDRPFDLEDARFALFGQADLELGFRLFRGVWMVGYAGMQAMADILTWQPVSTAVYYTPVAGLRLSFGR